MIILALMWMIPYLAVRTSSESAAGDLFALGLATLVLGSSALAGGKRHFPRAALLIAGLAFGLAFEFRYQIAFAVAGVVFWVALVGCGNRRRGLAAGCLILAGVLPPLIVGTAADCWGYGHWTLTPWNYFAVNILQHKADEFGTSPVWWYFYLMNEGLLVPITLLLTAAMLITWYRHPRHIITWATLPFFVAHSLVAHKEVRFLFPLTLVAIFFFLLAFAPDDSAQATDDASLDLGAAPLGLGQADLCGESRRAGRRLPDRQTARRRSAKIHLRQLRRGCHAYLVGQKNPYQNVGVNMYFYRPPGFVYRKLKSFAQLDGLLERGPRKFLLITDRISLASKQAQIVPQARLVWRSYPSWLENYNYLHWLDRSKTFSMYAIETKQPAAKIGAKPAATDKR